MYLISNEAWREAVELLSAYRRSAQRDKDSLREINRRRRAGLLAGKLLKCKKLTNDDSNGTMD